MCKGMGYTLVMNSEHVNMSLNREKSQNREYCAISQSPDATEGTVVLKQKDAHGREI